MLFYTISCIGLTLILKYGSILDWPRAWLSVKFDFFDELFKCSLCLGTWSGIIISLFIYYICPDDWETKYLLLPLISSFVSWIADPLVGIAYKFESKLDED